jgi:hypothetical protein
MHLRNNPAFELEFKSKLGIVLRLNLSQKSDNDSRDAWYLF